jgi:hypothetical protein
MNPHKISIQYDHPNPFKSSSDRGEKSQLAKALATNNSIISISFCCCKFKIKVKMSLPKQSTRLTMDEKREICELWLKYTNPWTKGARGTFQFQCELKFEKFVSRQTFAKILRGSTI